jgi:hypothetical protein
MTTKISANELFEQLSERLGLRWLAGREGAPRVLEAVDNVARRPSLAGYLNRIYPNKVHPRHRGTGLARHPGFAPALGDAGEDRPGPPAGTGDQQGPAVSGRSADRRWRIRHAAVDFAQARARVAQSPAISPRPHAGAAGDTAWCVHGDLLDRRADHRRVRFRQERTGAGTGHPRSPPGGR